MTHDSLRVLHVIPSMGYGGAERQAAYLAHGLVGLGHEVHFALFGGGENLPRLEQSRATIHRLTPASNYDPRRGFELRRLALAIRPDLVQTWLLMANVLGGWVARGLEVPWVYSERSTPSATRSRKADFDRWLAQRGAAAVISNSSVADAEWGRWLDGSRRGVIHNALPLDELDALPPADPTRFGLPPELPLVVYVGRMHPLKGIEALLPALAAVNAKRPITGLLLGAGEAHRDVQQRLAAPEYAGRTLAPGFRFDASAWVKRASVFVSLSRYEGMPNAVMEAMAVGCPIVLSDIPQHREILDDDSAWYTPVDDAAAAADAILRVLSAPEEARAKAARARASAEAWSVEATSRAWADLYARLVRGAR